MAPSIKSCCLRLLPGFALFLSASAAIGSETCGNWSAEVLKVASWSAVADDRQNITVSFSLQSEMPSATRMVEAQLRFYDALGRHVDTLSIDPYLDLDAGGVVETDARTRTQRLMRIAPGDLTAVACTKSALFEDGSTQVFTD